MKILNEEAPELVDIETLHEWPGNARTQDVDQIAEAIRYYGFYAILVVQKSTRNIIIGNHRWEGGKAAGKKRVLVFWADCTDEEGTRLNIWDNRVADKGDYDPVARIAQLEQMAQSELGLMHTGFDADEMAQYIMEHREPDLPEEEDDQPLGSSGGMMVECPTCHEEFRAADHQVRPSENPY